MFDLSMCVKIVNKCINFDASCTRCFINNEQFQYRAVSAAKGMTCLSEWEHPIALGTGYSYITCHVTHVCISFYNIALFNRRLHKYNSPTLYDNDQSVYLLRLACVLLPHCLLFVLLYHVMYALINHRLCQHTIL